MLVEHHMHAEAEAGSSVAGSTLMEGSGGGSGGGGRSSSGSGNGRNGVVHNPLAGTPDPMMLIEQIKQQNRQLQGAGAGAGAGGADMPKDVYVDQSTIVRDGYGCDAITVQARALADKFGALYGQAHSRLIPQLAAEAGAGRGASRGTRGSGRSGLQYSNETSSGKECFVAVLQDLMARSVPTQRGRPTITVRREFNGQPWKV
jgi:hypothetical protein